MIGMDGMRESGNTMLPVWISDDDISNIPVQIIWTQLYSFKSSSSSYTDSMNFPDSLSLSLYPSLLSIALSRFSKLHPVSTQFHIFISNTNDLYTIIWFQVIKVKLVTVVKGNQKAPFSIATTLKCRGEHNSFPGLLHFTLDTYLILQSVKQGGIKNHF